MLDDTSYESFEPEKSPKKNPLIGFAFFLGILSIVSSLFIYISLPCGALAIILVLITRTDKPLVKKAKVGLICGILGALITVTLTLSAFYFVFSNPQMRSLLEYYCQMYTGDSDFDLDEVIEEMFPFIDHLDTPMLNFSILEQMLPENSVPEGPSLIDPKGESTFL